ncbi:MAG: DUF3037 domain-containing protein [Planctomycetaceae bacterium]|jgi:hypothetical protein|nr:DUF3037 domain-containing protein [Planctomycetaceae bacterium]
MKDYCGYYSVIQYCPDRTLMEVAGIGVLLFCPELQFIDARMTTGHRRIERIFGKHISSDLYFDDYKNSLRTKFQKLSENLSVESIKQYLKTFVNDIHFTDIRTILISEPEADLDTLFLRLFNDDIQKTETPKLKRYCPTKNLLTMLYKTKDDMLEKIAVPKKVEVHEYESSIQPALVFLNESINIVVPRIITPANLAQQAGFGLAVGGLLAKHGTEWGASKMILLANAEGNKSGYFETFREIFQKNQIGYYDNENTLVKYIADHAKPLPESLKPFVATRQKNLVF